MTRALAAIFVLGLVLAACGRAPGEITDAPDAAPPASDDPAGAVDFGGAPTAAASPPPADTAVDLIDPSIPPAVAGQNGWGFSQAAEVDLTGDGAPERLVLTARVEMYEGRPAWDDGQPWQVYVEAPDGDRTYVYARRLQLGTLRMRVTSPDPGTTPSIILIEHLPDRLAVYEATYRAPQAAATFTRFSRMVDPRGDTASPDLP